MCTAAAPAAGLTPFLAHVTGRLRHLARGLAEPLRSPVSALAEHPGKGLRSALLRACAGFGVADWTRLVRLGAMVELLHMATLLHDDVVDRAVTRRGLPAAHTLLGNEGAMLAGLACFSLAGTEAAELGVASVTAATAASLAHGEMLDVERAFDVGLAMPDYIHLVQRKTGELFGLACVLGAASGGAQAPVVSALGRFGTEFGVAFQILDDCLDLEPGDSGKPAGTDHLLGLFGAPTLYALRADPGGELAAVLLAEDFSPRQLPAVHDLVRARGGLERARVLARTYYDRALAALDGLPAGPREELLALAGNAWRGPR